MTHEFIKISFEELKDFVKAAGLKYEVYLESDGEGFIMEIELPSGSGDVFVLDGEILNNENL